jgi:hypothetical protein
LANAKYSPRANLTESAPEYVTESGMETANGIESARGYMTESPME